MNPTPYDEAIKRKTQEMKAIQSTLNDLNQSRAEYLCPFKVGEILRDAQNQPRARIDRIGHHYGPYMLFVRPILKSGTEGKVIHELYRADWHNSAGVKVGDIAKREET